MERDLAGTALSSTEYEQLERACRHDRKFPKTYEGWKAIVALGTAELLAQGQEVELVALDVDEFVAWCRRVDVVPSFDALRAFMILRRRDHEGGQEKGATFEHFDPTRKGSGGQQDASHAPHRSGSSFVQGVLRSAAAVGRHHRSGRFLSRSRAQPG